MEIERFKNAIIKKNKTEILSFFKFPLEDTSVSLFNAKRKLHDGTNSNDDCRKTRPDEEEVCAEYAVSWVFKSDGEKLKILHIALRINYGMLVGFESYK